MGQNLDAAISGRNVARVRELLSLRPALIEETIRSMHTTKWGMSPLQLAASLGHPEVVRCLIDHGAFVDGIAHGSVYSPLGCVCRSHTAKRSAFDFVQTAQVLLSAGADARDGRADGVTPLHLVCAHYASASEPYLDVVEALLAAGAEIDAIDQDGQTPLIVACGVGTLSLITLLLEKGSDATRQCNAGSSLHAVARTLMHHGDIIVDAVVQRGADPNALNSKGLSPLHAAVAARNLAVAKALLQHGADVNSSDEHGTTPLALTLTLWNDHSASTALFCLLVDHGARFVVSKEASPFSVLMTMEPSALRTVLHTRRVPVDIRDPRDGRTLLHRAVETKDAGLVRLLLQLGAPVDATDQTRQTPIQHFRSCFTRVCFEGSYKYPFDVEMALLEYGADPSGNLPVDSFQWQLRVQSYPLPAWRPEYHGPQFPRTLRVGIVTLLALAAPGPSGPRYANTSLFKLPMELMFLIFEFLTAVNADIGVSADMTAWRRTNWNTHYGRFLFDRQLPRYVPLPSRQRALRCACDGTRIFILREDGADSQLCAYTLDGALIEMLVRGHYDEQRGRLAAMSGRVFLADCDAKCVSVFDAATRRRVCVLKLHGRPLDIAAAGGLVYVLVPNECIVFRDDGGILAETMRIPAGGILHIAAEEEEVVMVDAEAAVVYNSSYKPVLRFPHGAQHIQDICVHRGRLFVVRGNVLETFSTQTGALHGCSRDARYLSACAHDNVLYLTCGPAFVALPCFSVRPLNS